MSGSPDRPVRVNVERDRHAPRRCDEGHAAGAGLRCPRPRTAWSGGVGAGM